MPQRAVLPFVILLFAAYLPAQTPADDQAGEHFQAAREAEQARDLPTAVNEYKAALKLKPEIAEAWVNLGLDLYVMKKDDEAIAAFQQALQRKPDLLGANLFLGMAYLRNNQYEKSIAPLRKSIALNPKELKAYTNLSYAYQESGQEEEAAKVLQEANGIFPDNTEVLYNQGKLYTKLMEKSYKHMVEVDGDSCRVHQVLGDSYELRRDYPNAQAEYLKALEKSPDPYLPGLHYALGTSYWMEAKWDLAIEQFKRDLEISPGDYLSTWKLGDSYLFQRKYDEARPWLEKALKEKPGMGQAYRDLGKLCIQTGQPEEGLVYLKKVAQSDPREASVHFLMAQAYRKLGKQDEMKAELELFQKLKKQEADRATKRADTSALGGVESTTERPQEEESLDDVK